VKYLTEGRYLMITPLSILDTSIAVYTKDRATIKRRELFLLKTKYAFGLLSYSFSRL
jgi:hypothetical protein